MMGRVPQERLKRLENANELLEAIASCGRHFFRHDGRVSRFTFGPQGRVYLIDKYTRRRVYMHRHAPTRWFTEGGTLWSLCRALLAYIWTGKRIPARAFGPWPEWLCHGDLWAYGEDMEIVRRAAARLEITEAAS